MAKLDKTKPYGEVAGAMECGTRFFQDDKRFDVNGNEIATGAPAKAKGGKPVHSKQADLADEQIAEQLKDLT